MYSNNNNFPSITVHKVKMKLYSHCEYKYKYTVTSTLHATFEGEQQVSKGTRIRKKSKLALFRQSRSTK